MTMRQTNRHATTQQSLVKIVNKNTFDSEVHMRRSRLFCLGRRALCTLVRQWLVFVSIREAGELCADYAYRSEKNT